MALNFIKLIGTWLVMGTGLSLGLAFFEGLLYEQGPGTAHKVYAALVGLGFTYFVARDRGWLGAPAPASGRE